MIGPMVTGLRGTSSSTERTDLPEHICGETPESQRDQKDQRVRETRKEGRRTHRRAGGVPLVTQVEAAVQVDVPVVPLEQEQQRREASLEGQATLLHGHLATVGGTPGGMMCFRHKHTHSLMQTYFNIQAHILVLDEEVFQEVIRVRGVGGVAVLRNDHKGVSVRLFNRHAHMQDGAQERSDRACRVRNCVVGITVQRHGGLGLGTLFFHRTFKTDKI